MAERILAGRRWAESSPRRSRILVATAIAAAALVTWIVTIGRMDGTNAGPGTNLGGIGWFVGVWATMTAAMMLPSMMPTTLVFARISAEHQRLERSFINTWVFIPSTAWWCMESSRSSTRHTSMRSHGSPRDR